MRALAWVKTLFRGTAVADQARAHQGLGPALEERHSQIRGLFTRIDAHLRNNETAEAEASCQQLTSLTEQMPATEASAESRHFLAATFFDLGSRYRILSKRDEAEKAYEQALNTWQELSSVQPDDAQILARIAGCKNHLGILYLETGSLQQATGYFLSALALRQRLLGSDPQDEENLVYLGGTLCNVGKVAAVQNDAQTALTWYHRSIDTLDRSIPGCDCGCRDTFAKMISSLTGRTSPSLIAQQFLRNALDGRAALLAKQSPGLRYRRLRCSKRDNSTVISILTEELGARRSSTLTHDEALQELKRELLDAITFASGSVIFDLQAVKDMDADGVALLLHLRGRLVGRGEWPSLCGLSQELRAATPSVPWDDDFKCYLSVDAALADVDG
jgi:tetratricopeptide (TPR) repeat protein